MTGHRHTWQATLYDGRWVEYTVCSGHDSISRKARINRHGNPVALPRKSPGGRIERPPLAAGVER